MIICELMIFRNYAVYTEHDNDKNSDETRGK